ncbi:CIC11C00000001336 [Sungouiella intermedia]|uniref:CIC11C00000001336 n=1 Tax=Sungouiella intermedia TaxID=45354 RepID=A0A1L0BTC8_9ASCO|nr:CIC11C00000001336 [[Candida] intermedia]
MEELFQNLSIDSDVSELIQKGTSLSKSQWQTLEKQLKEKHEHLKFLKILQEFPENTLKAVLAHHHASTLIVLLVDTESCGKSVLESVKQTISISYPPDQLQFYLNICLNVCLRYPALAMIVFPSLMELLASINKTVHNLVVLTLTLICRQNPDESAALVVKFLDSAIVLQSCSELLFFAALETFFPIFPSQVKAIYISNKCKDGILEKVSQLPPQPEGADSVLAEQILRAVSLSCIDEETRKFNMEHYLDLFIAGANLLQNKSIVALSLLCLIKLWNFSSIEKKISLQTVLEKTQNLMRSCEVGEEYVHYVIEALSYLSLGASVKQSLRLDEEVSEKLLLVLETEKNSSVIYGALVVFLNLSEIKGKGGSEDASTVNYLKSISLPNKNDIRDDEATIKLFNESLVENHKLVGTLRGLDLKTESIITQAVQIIFNLSQSSNKSIQRAIVSQGGLTLLLKYLTEHSTIKKGTDRTEAFATSEGALFTRLSSLRALAVICRSVNPKLLISEFDIKTAVPFLVELLGPEVSDYTTSNISTDDATAALGASISSFDRLCGLLALTNLSSLQEKYLTAIIIRRAFDGHLKDLMIDSSIADIQKAAWELINNLIADPQMLAKFFNTDNAESMKNLDVLVKMLHSRDVDLQIVIAGLLANATLEFGLVLMVILSKKEIFAKLFEIASNIMQTQASNDDLLIRVCSFLLNIVETASLQKQLEGIQNNKSLKAGIKNVVLTTKNKDIMLTIREIIEAGQLKF